jgi:hypothetical protein
MGSTPPSSRTIAILNLPQYPVQPSQTALPNVTVAFISEAGNEKSLTFIGPDPQDTGMLLAGIWNTAYATYSWDQNKHEISWGMHQTNAAGPFDKNGLTTIEAGGVSTASTPVATSSPSTPSLSTASSSVTSSVTPSTAITSSSGVGSSTATTSTGTTKPTQNSTKGLATGAVAGVAIGCLFAGALIAGLLACFLFKKKQKSNMRDSEASSMALINREKGPTAKTMSVESGSPIAAGLEGGLPLPLEDKAISGEISKIGNLIKNHVQSYYHAGHVSPVLIDYDDLQALGSDMPVSAGTLSTLLENSSTREIALRYCIAWIVISRIQLGSPPQTTFLPPEVAQCFEAMAPAGHASRGESTRCSVRANANLG